MGEKSVFTVLGSKLREAKRRKEEEERERKAREREAVVDDWEEEAGREEEGRGAQGGKPASEIGDGDVQNTGVGIEGVAMQPARGDGGVEEFLRTKPPSDGDTAEKEAVNGAPE